MNGWLRIWIVTAGLVGLSVLGVAFMIRPTRSNIYVNWCYDGVSALTPTIQPSASSLWASFDFSNQIRDEGTQVCTQRLQRIQALRISPAAAAAVALVNAKYLQQGVQFPRKVVEFWLSAVAAWLACCAVLWILGWSIAWVRRGFVRPAP